MRPVRRGRRTARASHTAAWSTECHRSSCAASTSPTPVVITKGETSCARPFWSPDGTRIFYLSTSASALWSIGVAGGAAEKILPEVHRAALSPDGKTLAFLRYESADETSARLGLWLSSPPGAAPHKYEHPPISGMRYYNGAVEFSPDGKTLGFWMQMWDGRPEFWLLPMPSGDPKQPFLGWKEWVPIDQFRWTPDSRQVLFPYHRPGSPGLHLWIADTHSGRLQQVTSGSGNETAPAISPDGRSVAFTAYDNQGDLVQIPLDGTSMGMLRSTSRNESGVAWSPSGLEYAYVTDRSGVPEIWLAEARTGRAWPIVSQKEFGSDIDLRMEGPAFSPDGQRIAFSRFGTERGKSGAIWISPVSGGQPVRAINESEENPQIFSPSWSPDGNSFAFLNSQAGLFSLATAAAGGGAHAAILKDKIAIGEVKWSPKGDWILYRRPDSLAIISPDGKTDRVLSKQPWILYTWSKDGTRVYAVRAAQRHYTVAAIDVPGGSEKTLSEGDLPPGASLGAGPECRTGWQEPGSDLIYHERRYLAAGRIPRAGRNSAPPVALVGYRAAPEISAFAAATRRRRSRRAAVAWRWHLRQSVRMLVRSHSPPPSHTGRM